jgi:hypothetical protein
MIHLNQNPISHIYFHSPAKSIEMEEILTPEQWYDLRCELKLKYPELRNIDLQYHAAVEKDLLIMAGCTIQMNKERRNALRKCRVLATSAFKTVVAVK